MEKTGGTPIRAQARTNQQIRAREVRLVDEDGEQLGIVEIQAALAKAQEKNLDLVEVAPDADPIVCRIMDFAKHMYEQKRKQKLAKKKTTRVDTKEIKLRPNIDPHDFGIKLKHAREFLEKGNKVKITVRYRPREMRHYEIGTKRLDKMVEELNDIATVESSQRGNTGLRMQLLTMAPREKLPTKKSKPEEGAEPKPKAEAKPKAAEVPAAAAENASGPAK